jgi:hypothetical protein
MPLLMELFTFAVLLGLVQRLPDRAVGLATAEVRQRSTVPPP